MFACNGVALWIKLCVSIFHLNLHYVTMFLDSWPGGSKLSVFHVNISRLLRQLTYATPTPYICQSSQNNFSLFTGMMRHTKTDTFENDGVSLAIV